MRGVTSVIVQTHQILRLPRKMNLMIDPWHKWNVIYNARSNMRHSPNSPNTAPATKNDRPKSQRNLLKTDETSFPMRGRSENDPRMIRPWSENDPTMIREWNRQSATRLATEVIPFTPTTSILYWKIQHFALRLSFQISPNTAPATKSDTCTSPNTAPATKSDTCTSPNTAPATKSNTHHWSSSHMKRYLQCAEWQVSLSKLTKYCACHEKWPSKISKKFAENGWSVISNARPIREWSENDPTMIREWNRQSATRLATEVTFHAHHEHFVLKNTTFRAPAIIPNFTEYCACHEKWHLHFTKYCACHEKWHDLHFTQYCACHEKWHSSLILFTHETLFTMRGVTSVIVQSHQILRLPRKMTVQNLKEICWKRMKRHFQCAADPRMIRPWSDHDPRMKPSVRNPPRNRGYLSRPPRAFCIEKYNISRSGYHSKFHRILRLPRKVTLALHQILRLPRTVTLALHPILRLPRKVTLELHQILRLPRKVTLELHQILRLPRKVTLELQQILSYYLTELLLTELLWLDRAMTWLIYYLTELLLDWAITYWATMTWQSYDLTDLLLDWAITWLSYDLTELWLDWAMTWLSYCLTELWLDWAMTCLSYDLTGLWLVWAITWLSYYLTELWLDWAVTWLSYDLTELLLDWAMTWLNYDLTELLLDWAVTWLSCDLTELWLDWAMTWLSYGLTELLLDWAITWLCYWAAISFVYRKFLNLNFLRSYCIFSMLRRGKGQKHGFLL